MFSAKGAAFGLGYENTVPYLEHTRSFLSQLGYEDFFIPDYWNAPANYNSKYGALIINPEKTVVAQFYPIKSEIYNSINYNVLLDLYNYDYFMKRYNNDLEVQEEKIENSGFKK